MSDERIYRMELQYTGTGLHGWAKQAGLQTVEGCLEQAFETVLGRVPYMRVAGRTDAGVHARRQVVSLRLPRSLDRRRLLVSLNGLTPDAIAVTRLVGAPDNFDARRDAKSRSYRYHLLLSDSASPFWKPYAWWIPTALDVSAMREAAELIVGRHDFTAFTPTLTEHSFFRREVLHCAWRVRREKLLVLEVEADAFLRHMVRALVGTMVEVGRGKRDIDGFQSLLAGAPREAAGLTAPARGLVLWDIKY